ncbi:MAG: hypothetical protein P4N41_02160 [Negativicutes bacterium]|nr:hypothetical protein [Negativicutes bacterium]
MGELFQVAIHHDNDCGYIEYDPDARQIKVILDDAAKRGEVEAYLGRKHLIRVATDLCEFSESTGFPAESLANLKLVLAHLWRHTGVFVDWSRPVASR